LLCCWARLDWLMPPKDANSRRFRRESLAHSERRVALPLIIFAGVLALYAATSAAITISGGYELLALVPASGILVVMLFVIGHDACHQSFTPSRRLNSWIGRIAFLPSLHVYGLWEREHNGRHHRYNNIRGMDYAWIPWSPAQFAEARPLRRLGYRIARAPGGVFFYYLFAIWAPLKIFPRLGPEKGAARPVGDTAIVWGFILVYGFLLGVVADANHRPAEISILLALIAPFIIFSMMISVATFLHHTHFAIPWYRDVEQWRNEDGALAATVHVRFPWVLRKLILNIMEHHGHHIAPGVPLYRLRQFQATFPESAALTWDFTILGYATICARCKLFDYAEGRWTDFAGRATSDRLYRFEPAAELEGYVPQRSAAVWTGASQSLSAAPSASETVSEQPAISSEVT